MENETGNIRFRDLLFRFHHGFYSSFGTGQFPAKRYNVLAHLRTHIALAKRN